jgi:hypothetical protein
MRRNLGAKLSTYYPRRGRSTLVAERRQTIDLKGFSVKDFLVFSNGMEFNDFVDSEDEILTILVPKMTVAFRFEPTRLAIQNWCVRSYAGLYSNKKAGGLLCTNGIPRIVQYC